ncbi:hypothetical protein M9Y10_015619 [Tritrichomonas musculus]|uniref:Protein kinase domain-containing protein n=1 Tax=Tritrichomonas musculus TaxID=1915356 RepID=A0ABR2L2S5_9EUKA
MEELQLLSLEDFILQNKIGAGAFGKVYKVKERRTGNIYAAKISIRNIETNSNDLKLDIFREVNIISKLNHPSVLKFITYSPINFKKKSKPVIITEFASNGSLDDLIFLERSGAKANINYDDTQKLIIIYGIASGMSYLHSHNIIHRDLKPGNILLDDFLFPKIADFGLSKTTHQNEESLTFNSTLGAIKGTPKYISPEIWKKAEYTKACDVYAFSIILYEIITNIQPFKDFNFFEISYKVIEGYRPKFLKKIPESYKNLIERCWEKEPENRPTFDEILNQLRNDRGFITDQIDEEKFKKYVKYIDDYKTSFNEFVKPNNFEHVKVNEMQDKIIENADLFMPKLFPFKKFIELNEKCKKMVEEAENNSEKQYQIGKHLIKCQYFFPQNTELGIKYLKESIKGGCKNALIYYIKMLIKGKVIPQNNEKAKKLLDNKLKEDVGNYYLLHGILNKKEKKYDEALKCFEKSMNENNGNAMCEYATMIYEGNGLPSDEERAFKYYKKDADNGCVKALFKLGKILKVDMDNDKGIPFLKLAAEKGNPNAQFYYSWLIEEDEIDTDDETESIEYLKKSAYQGNVEAMKFLYQNLFGEEDIYDQKELVYFLKILCDKGDIELMYYYGRTLMQGLNITANRKEGAKYIKIAAENGVTEAISFYGKLLHTGVGVDVDKEQAFEYYLKGIDKDDSDSMYYYALMLKNGDFVQANINESLKYLKKAIDKGNSSAMNYYAQMLSMGDGIPVNKEEAIKYYKMAIEKGNIESMNNYALMLSEGDGIPVNKERAIRYFKMAIKNGSEDAKYNYAIMLLEDENTPSNKEEAVKYYEQAFLGGDEDVQHNYSMMVIEDETPSNKEEAIYYLKMLVKNGDKDAMFRYAVLLSEGDLIEKNDEEAIKYLKMAIEKGQTSAMFYYARLLIKGIGTNVDKEEGLKYLNMSIEKGNVDSIYYYGELLYEGNYIEMNKEKGIKYLKMAADKGCTDAMIYYASVLDKSENSEKNKKEVLKYYKMAADLENTKAMKYYSIMLSNGDGVEVNMDEALNYIKKAVEKGDPDAINRYAVMLIDGDGVEPNIEEGIKYLKMAIDKGYPEAFENYANLLKNGVGVELNRRKALKYYKMAIEKGCSDAKEEYEQLLHSIENEEEEEEEEYLEKTPRIKRRRSLPSLNRTILAEFNKVDEKGKRNIINAENEDLNSMFYVGTSLVDGENNFTQNKENGIKYLEKACKKKHFESITFYIDYLLNEDYELNKRRKMLDLFDDWILITNLTDLKMKFVDILLSKESFDVNLNSRNMNINYVLAKQISKECADFGNPKAMTKYAYLCMKEKKNRFGEIHHDFKEAVHYFELAAKKGDADGMVQYGRFIEFGFVVTNKNPELAVQYYKRAYKKGDLNGYSFYGISLIEGTGGISQNISEGIRLIKHSCNQKNIFGITFYSHYLYFGLPELPENEAMSFHYAKIAADLGSSKSLRDLGFFYKEGEVIEKDINKSIMYFKMAIEEGDIQAAYYLGNLLFNGDEDCGLKENWTEGNKYLKYAADNGNEKALYEYLVNIVDSSGMKISRKKILKYFNKGVELGNKDIIYYYGLTLLRGKKLNFDQKSGVKYIKMAADLGNDLAIETYAELLESGFGVRKDLDEAKRYRDMIVDTE